MAKSTTSTISSLTSNTKEQSQSQSQSTSTSQSTTQAILNKELLDQILAGLQGGMTDEEITRFAEALLRPQLNAGIEAAQQEYESTKLAKEQEIENLAASLAKSVEQQQSAYRQSIADVETAALSRGMGRSSYTLQSLANQFKKMVKFFHDNEISHGDLQHGNIRIRPNGTICVLDYDSMYVPALEGKKEYIKGLPSFQHPTARDANEFLNPKVDYFSESVIYLALMLLIKDPSLWTNEVKRCDDILLFDNNDLLNINNTSSRIFKYRNEVSHSILWLVRYLQSFMKQDSLNSLLPLEKVIDPYIHGEKRSQIQTPKPQPITVKSSVNVADVINSLKK